jgi:rubrerythrin
MAGIFKVNEVVSAAVEMERKGEQFYLHLASLQENRDIQKDLEYLAKEEVRHREIFQSILDRLGQIEIPAGSDESEYWNYMNALIDSYFLFQKVISERPSSWITRREDAIHVAIGFEKDSILFFTEMMGLVPEREKSIVDSCIQEEKGHLIKLKGMLKGC